MSGKITVQITVKVNFDPYKEVEVDECLFRCYESGKVERQINGGRYGKKGDWKRCDNIKSNNNRGYGYIRVKVPKDNKNYLLHRLVYLAFNPTFDINDTKIQIDHINGDSFDNRPSNLREATGSENTWNRKVSKNSKLGLKNIHDHGAGWVVQIRKNGRKVVDKYFNKSYALDDVISFRDAELLKHHGEFARV